MRLLLLFLALNASAATWYVRPGVWTTVDGSGHPIPTPGVYGAQDGTSYANAWNGITSIVWGGGGVNTGDTLYVAGTHVYTFQFLSGTASRQGETQIGVSGITIRMDYPGDTGLVFGGQRSWRGSTIWSDFTGPDANGVYYQTITSGTTPAVFYAGTNIVRLKKRTTTTWTDGLGGQFLSNLVTNYVQLPNGERPTTNNVARAQFGWAFDLNFQSNITFLNCNFEAADPVGNSFGAIRHTIPSAPFDVAASNITFTGCTSFDSQPFYIYRGEDHFAFYNTEMARCASCIYTLINGQSVGPHNLTVSNCWLHDAGTAEYDDGDAHGVGIQGGNYHLITHNTISNTGAAIVLFTGAVDMKSNTISYNFINNTHISSVGNISDGIGVSGDNATALAGRRDGIKIFGNVIRNCAVGGGALYQGVGISCNSPDYTEINNNTIYGGNMGIDWEVVHTGYGANGKVVDNIIYNPARYRYYIVGNVASTNMTLDYNLYYPTNGGTQFQFSPTPPAHDAHSVFNQNPLFVSVFPATAIQFNLQSPSPAKWTGTAVSGYTVDYAGNTVSNPPSMGAFEYILPTPPPPIALHLLRAKTLRLGNLISR